MVFVRTKTIKGKDYYYLVKSVRNGGKVNQVTLEYLGAKRPLPEKVIRLKNKYQIVKDATT